MTKPNDKVIKKIKKCLRLAQSGNANEAANAIRIAQQLMEKHGISDSDVKISDVCNSVMKAGDFKDMPNYLAGLLNIIRDAFGVEVVMHTHWSVQRERYFTEARFFGIDNAAELAAYAFDVLRRQLVSARAEYIKNKLRGFNRRTKTRRADIFAEAAVATLYNKVRKFAMTDDQKQTIKTGIANHYQKKSADDFEKAKTRETNPNTRDLGAMMDGVMAGKEMSLNHGVSGSQQAKISFSS